jgi:hypothetical protein
MTRTWVSPDGELHDVADKQLYAFCKARHLHYENMVDHIERPTSDQKNDGWRLIERLKAIGHISRPTQHVLALGTLEHFHAECGRSTDGRAVLKDRKNLSKLLGGSYKGGGKAWNGWELRVLTTAEKRQLLAKLAGEQQPLATAEPAAAATNLPDFASFVQGARPVSAIRTRSHLVFAVPSQPLGARSSN